MAGEYVFDDVPDVFPPEVLLLADSDEYIEVHIGAREQRVLFAYSDFPTLASLCGPAQPWVRASSEALPALAREHGLTLVMLDVPSPVDSPSHNTRVELDYLEPLPQVADEPDGYWVASRPYQPGHRQVVAEMQRDNQGRLVVLAYSSWEMVQQCCGPYQAAVRVRTERLSEFATAVGAHGVLFNPVLDEQSRHKEPVVYW